VSSDLILGGLISTKYGRMISGWLQDGYQVVNETSAPGCLKLGGLIWTKYGRMISGWLQDGYQVVNETSAPGCQAGSMAAN